MIEHPQISLYGLLEGTPNLTFPVCTELAIVALTEPTKSLRRPRLHSSPVALSSIVAFKSVFAYSMFLDLEENTKSGRPVPKIVTPVFQVRSMEELALDGTSFRLLAGIISSFAFNAEFVACGSYAGFIGLFSDKSGRLVARYDVL